MFLVEWKLLDVMSLQTQVRAPSFREAFPLEACQEVPAEPPARQLPPVKLLLCEAKCGIETPKTSLLLGRTFNLRGCFKDI